MTKACQKSVHWVLALTLLTTCYSSFAEEAKPFYAEYKVKVNKIPSRAKASLHLIKQDNGLWNLQFIGRHYLGRIHEKSIFEWNECEVKSIEHHFMVQSLSIREERKSTFDWSQKTLFVQDDDTGEHALPLPNNLYDEINFYLAARCILQNGDTDKLSFQIARGERLKKYEYKIIKEEKIKTPAGRFTTLVLEKSRRNSNRKTLLWIAPELDHMLVKIKHVETLAFQAEITLKSFSEKESKIPTGLIDKDARF